MQDGSVSRVGGTQALLAGCPNSITALRRRFNMRILVRSVGVALLVMVATVLLALTSTMTSVFTLAAVTYIIRGTQYALPLCVPFCAPPPNISSLPTAQQNIDLGTTYITGTLGNGPLNQQITLLPYPANAFPLSVRYFDAPTYGRSVATGV